MHTVIVDADISYPPTSGKRLRTLHLMRRLAQRHQVTYIARGDLRRPETAEARTYLGDHGIETVLVDHPVPHKAGLAFYGRLAANLLSKLPYSVASHASRPLRAAVGEYAARHEVDLWQFEWLPYLSALSGEAAARRLVMAHNVDTLIWQRYYETARGRLKRLFLRRQWRKMERFERDQLPRADWVVAVSADDARLIRETFSMPRVEVVDNGIDRNYFESIDGGRREAQRILFVGALDWRPNIDAVELLVERIFPRVLAEEPSARLCVVGRHPPPGLRQRIVGMAGVELHADVPDVRPFLGQCGVMAVPLRIGGGSRLKILEALACGLPVVSTSVGAEGLCLEPDRDYVRADGIGEMAAALVQAVREPVRVRAMARQAQALVLDRYDWDVLAAKLEKVWEKCVIGHSVLPPLSPGGERGGE
jgi:glycosyltransferase involved in cell wall biosynthesis